MRNLQSQTTTDMGLYMLSNQKSLASAFSLLDTASYVCIKSSQNFPNSLI